MAAAPQLVVGMLSKLLSHKKSKKNSQHNSISTSGPSNGPSRRPGLPTSVAVISILVVFVALILSILCLFAGSKPGFLEEYSIFTLNVSRIGENFRDKIDDEIRSIHIKRSLQPSRPDVPAAMITAPPTTLIQVRSPVALDLPGGSDVDSLLDGAKSKAKKLTNEAGQEVSSVKSAAESAASSAIDSLQEKAIQLVNEAYSKFVNDVLDLEDFYSLHVQTTCWGTYVTSDGKNITVGGNVMPDKGTHEHVDRCEKHSVLDPIQAVRALYITGIVLIAFTLLLAIGGVFIGKRASATCSILVSGLAFVLVGMLTAVIHGLTFIASKVINTIGEEGGLEMHKGGLVILSWTVVGLLGFHTILLAILGQLRHRAEKKSSQEPIEMKKPQYVISRPYHPENTYDRGQRL